MKLFTIVPLLAFLALAGAFAIGLTNAPPRVGGATVVRELPAFDLAPLRPGEPGLAKADFSGQVAMVHIFASWCPSCVVEHPTMMSIARSGVPIYGVAWQDKPNAAAGWIDRYGNPYTATGDDQDGRLGVDLGVTGTPETFIVDARGRVRWHQVGPISTEIWARDLAPLIADLQREADESGRS